MQIIIIATSILVFPHQSLLLKNITVTNYFYIHVIALHNVVETHVAVQAYCIIVLLLGN